MELEDSYGAGYQLSDEERRRLIIGNILLGVGGGLMSGNNSRGSWLSNAGQGLVLGAQMGGRAVSDAQAGKIARAKADEAIAASRQKRELAKAEADRLSTMRSGLYGGAGGSPVIDHLRGIGVPDAAIQLALSEKDPFAALSKLAEGYSKPINPAGQVPVVRTQNGFKAVLPEGAAAAYGEITAAQERARAQYDLVDVPDGRGGMIRMPRAQALGGQPSVGVAANPPLTPEQQRWVEQNGGAGARNLGPQFPPAAGAVGWAPGKVEEESAIAAARAQQERVTKTQGAAVEDFIKNAYRPTLDAGKTAVDANASIDMLEKLKDVTGASAPAKLFLARWATSIGIPSDKAAEFAASGEIFQQYVMKRNWALLNEAKGPQTEGDAQRALKTDAQLQGTPMYNQYVMDVTRATNNLTIRRAKFYQQNYGKAIANGDPYSLEAAWAQSAGSIWDDPSMQKWRAYGVSKEEAINELKRRRGQQ